MCFTKQRGVLREELALKGLKRRCTCCLSKTSMLLSLTTHYLCLIFPGSCIETASEAQRCDFMTLGRVADGLESYVATKGMCFDH